MSKYLIKCIWSLFSDTCRKLAPNFFGAYLFWTVYLDVEFLYKLYRLCPSSSETCRYKPFCVINNTFLQNECIKATDMTQSTSYRTITTQIMFISCEFVYDSAECSLKNIGSAHFVIVSKAIAHHFRFNKIPEDPFLMPGLSRKSMVLPGTKYF